VIPSIEDLDSDILATMNSLQCFKDREKLVHELLSLVYVSLSFVVLYY